MPTPTTGSPTSPVPPTGNPQLDGLIVITDGAKWGGAQGTAVEVSYSFPDLSSTWSTIDDPNGYDAADPQNNNPYAPGYHGLDAAQQDAVRESLAAWSHVANISFLEVAETPTEVGDIRVAFTDGGGIGGDYAYAYTPAPFAYAGDVWLNTVQPVAPGYDFSSGAAGYSTVIHELGHAIGLGHPFEGPAFPAQFDSFKYTVMSYSDFPGHQDTGFSSLYPTTPMPLDILALQYLYGVNTSWHAGDDTYTFTEGGRYYETIWDAGGNDTIEYLSALDGARIDLRAGNFSQLGASITLSNGALQQDDVAIAFNVVIENAVGGGGNDEIIGNAAGNTLSGGAGNDTMTGGAGNDTYIVDAFDTLIEVSGGGIDTVRSGSSYVLSAANVENVTLTGGGALNATGNALANVLTGTSGDNVLDGGAGTDTLIGGDGNDTYKVNTAGDSVLESNVAGGTDLVLSSASFTLGANVENLTLTGGGAINATGNELDNALTGNSGANVLDGQAGADTLAGGPGNDSYVFDGSDTVLEAPGEGADTVRSAVSYVLAIANVENVTLTGADAIDATGDAAANLLTGNSGANVLDGRGGADTLAGGGGNDSYVVDALDTLIESAGGGTDTVLSGSSYVLSAANVENLTLNGGGAINATGNALANVLTGNSGDNVLDGGTGNDTLAGGAGNDTFVIYGGDTVIEADGEGIDTILAGFTCSLPGYVENLFLTGSGNFSATGNELDDTLTGNSGANVLDGQGGADTLAGGGGNDSYVIDGSDTVIEAAGEGIDTILAGFTYSLAEHFENLTLTGTGNIDATGNAADNVLTGNAFDNILNGGGGNDTMIGGAGDDTYFVVENADTVTEAANAGHDTVNAWRSFNLPDGVEDLNLLGAAAINGTGNALNNVMHGNRNDNLLGGGAGNDSYFVNGGGDVVTEAVGAGTDTVNSGINFTLGANLEKLVLTGNARLGTGNALDNRLTGDARNNTLEGGAGNDTLDGGAGFDTLLGGPGNDSFLVDSAADRIFEFAGGGTDTVRSTAAYYRLGDEIENLIFEPGAGNAQGFGNSGNNVLTGNAGDDTLAGGEGNDTLVGNAGADTFVFDTAPNAASNKDTIGDFLSGTDELSFDHAVFTALGAEGPLAAGMLRSGAGVSSAADADDYLIYNTTTGALYYDADGSGAGVAVQVATLTGHPTLLAADVQIS